METVIVREKAFARRKEKAMATAKQLREEFVRGLERMQMDYAILDESDNFMSVSLVLSKVAVTVYVEFDKTGITPALCTSTHLGLRNLKRKIFLKYIRQSML